MAAINNKIDFSVVFSVKKANPNGDPLNGNRPRIDFNGFGEVSDVCIKRKIRNRLMDFGEKVFVQSDDRKLDNYDSLKDRSKSCKAVVDAEKDADKYAKAACEEWIDVRGFGQVFAFKGDNLSVGVRGPVSIQTAVSLRPISESDMQITKSVNSVSEGKKSSDTMGLKSRVDYAVYRFNGSINCQLAEKTGFTEEDAEAIKKALISLFENDSSAARPDGSMEILKVYWWKHDCRNGQYSSAKVHRSLTVTQDEQELENITFTLDELEGLEPEVYDGL